MKRRNAPALIRLVGVRQNNLKGFDLDLPARRLIVVTGLSGSGKSSLAFETLFAEGQRRYIETFSPYARQFFDRMDKPKVDRVEGIPPAIAIEQRNSVRTTRSTVGTMTELCDYLKVVWAQGAQLRCRGCGEAVERDLPSGIWARLPEGTDLLVTFDLALAPGVSLEESLALVLKQGYQRLVAGERVLRLDEAAAEWATKAPAGLTVLQDRLVVGAASRARFGEACEQAFHFGKGRLAIRRRTGAGPDAEGRWSEPERFSNRRHCARCDLEYKEASPAMFSFNHPLGACETCRGFGRTISIDYARAVPDRSRTLAEGVVRPWLTGHGLESQRDLMRFCRKRGVATDQRFDALPADVQRWVIDGDPGYGCDVEHEWPKAWYGVKGYFRWLESKSYKMHYRVLLSRYRTYTPCAACRGTRFSPDSLLYRLAVGGGRELTLPEFLGLPVAEAHRVVRRLAEGTLPEPLSLALREVESRLDCLDQAGLGYLSLDRPTRTLSGGETERVNLTSCLGSRLVDALYVLDEPTVGLHPRDTARLVGILQGLRDLGNTVVVVEHEPEVMRAADQIVDLGPGHGEAGGQVVFQGTLPQILRWKNSLTADYLSGRRAVSSGPRRPVDPAGGAVLQVRGATLHNLRDLAVALPLNRFVCVTGVSGSGKSTLIRDLVFPALEDRLRSAADGSSAGSPQAVSDEETGSDPEGPGSSEGAGRVSIEGWEALGRALLVDQSTLGRTPRSNPAVYVGAFDAVRELFAQSDEARRQGCGASAFSFNSSQGQCERCRGAGFEKVEMQFLSDVFIRCPACGGARYRKHVLAVRVPWGDEKPGATAERPASRRASTPRVKPPWSIADWLSATIDDATRFLQSQGETAAVRRARRALRPLQEVGLGYLRAGQPINTLSGGESQRLKLAGHLAEFDARQARHTKPTAFFFDEPTTGLHFEDVRILVGVFQRLVEEGHSVVVIEHNLSLVRCADWVIDLGPEAGDGGGRLVVQGTPEEVAACPTSHTGRALRDGIAPGASVPGNEPASNRPGGRPVARGRAKSG